MKIWASSDFIELQIKRSYVLLSHKIYINISDSHFDKFLATTPGYKITDVSFMLL